MDLQMKARPMVMTAFKGHCQLEKHKGTEKVLSPFVASNHYINVKNKKKKNFLNFPIIFFSENILVVIFTVSSPQ